MSLIIQSIDKYNIDYELYIEDTKETLKFDSLKFDVSIKGLLMTDTSLYFTWNPDKEYRNHIYYAMKLNNFDHNEEIVICRKIDYKFDAILYEIINNKKTKVLELKNAYNKSVDFEDCNLELVSDLYILNPDSFTANKIVQLQDKSRKEYETKQQEIYNFEKHIAKDLDIDPNESVFQNNFRKSFVIFDWFKKYKII